MIWTIELHNQYQSLVRYIASRYLQATYRTCDYKDLIQIGNIGLYKGICLFKDDKNTTLKNWLWRTINAALYSNWQHLTNKSQKHNNETVSFETVSLDNIGNEDNAFLNYYTDETAVDIINNDEDNLEYKELLDDLKDLAINKNYKINDKNYKLFRSDYSQKCYVDYISGMTQLDIAKKHNLSRAKIVWQCCNYTNKSLRYYYTKQLKYELIYLWVITWKQ
jgi:RNA polymerase sigma factor (sigma-70 family)